MTRCKGSLHKYQKHKRLRRISRNRIVCGKFSHVPSQPAGIPSPRSMLSGDKRLPIDTWNLFGSQENVNANPRSMFETPYQRILHSTTPSATGAVPVHGSTGTLVARGEGRIGSTITMPTFAGRPSTMNSFCQWIFHRILCLDSKDSIYRNFNLVNSPHLQRFHVGR